LFRKLRQVLADITAQLAASQPSPALLHSLDQYTTLISLAVRNEARSAFKSTLLHAEQGLLLYSLLLTLWPLDATPAAWDPSIDVAAVSLALTAAQQVSKWLDALPADSPEPSDELLGLLQSAPFIRCLLRRGDDPAALQSEGPGQLPRFAPLLLSQQYTEAICMGFLHSTYSSTFRAQKELQASGAGSRSPQQQGTVVGSSSGQPANQWARACALAQQLPPCQQELLQALGCSGKVLLWGALRNPLSMQTHKRDLSALVTGYEQLADLCTKSATLPVPQRGTQLQAGCLGCCCRGPSHSLGMTGTWVRSACKQAKQWALL
jgi:hypothetical protein